MDYINYTLALLINLFIFIAIIKIYMKVASYIGEQLRFGKFFIYLCEKIRKNKLSYVLYARVKFKPYKQKMKIIKDSTKYFVKVN